MKVNLGSLSDIGEYPHKKNDWDRQQNSIEIQGAKNLEYHMKKLVHYTIKQYKYNDNQNVIRNKIKTNFFIFEKGIL